MNFVPDLLPKPAPKARAKEGDVGRRSFIKLLSALTAGAIAMPDKAEAFNLDEFLQKHFHQMTDEEKQKTMARLEGEYNEKYSREDFSVDDSGPQHGVKYGYALNLSKCIGCRQCTHACVDENNQHRGDEERGDQIEYIRVLEMEKGSLDVEKSVHDYTHEVPAAGKYYMPVQCHHCNDAPCVKACPVEATWQEPDGIVVVDYNWCIGCRYCAAACPYWARKVNWVEPRIPDEEVNPDTHYLGNRPRYNGVMEKCTFCITRVRKGLNPACHDICPTGSRKFGNLLDTESVVRRIIDQKSIFILKEEVGTDPSFYYFFD
ncbi:MAG: 4Fe-4S dicluster domain-containing protein [Candidatus Krumholzibacteria bacterium]|nr:4Fe-4S dicluster domain-containing protein [Candidatus Krumholzibacteria bacterium]